MSKKILAVVLALVMVFSVMLPMTIATAATGNWGEITYQIIDGKLYITAVTDASYNRLGLFYADDTAVSACIETTNSYVEEGDNRVWTLKIDAPYEPTEFVIRGRSAETNTYKAGGISDAFEVTPEYPFYYVETVAIAGKVTVTVKSTSPYVDRVAVVNPETGKTVGYDATPDAGEDFDGETVWKITFPYDENVDTYIVRARDTRTGIYDRKAVAEAEIYFHEEPIVDVEITDYDEENILVKVTTIPDIARVKVAFADDATGHIAYARNYSYETEDYTWVWEMIIAKPEVTTEYAVDCALSGVIYSRYYTYKTYEVEVEEEVIPAAPGFFEDAANTIVNGWYTTTDGLVKMYVGDWVYYGSYGLTLVAAYTAPVDAATIAVYAADSDEVFANKTADDFAAVLGEAVTSFEAVTIAGQYPGYVAKTATYINLVFQANGSKYFINYINADDGIAIDDVAARAFENIVVCKPAPDAEANANAVVDGWYTTSNGLVQAYVGNWVYYGSYGLTLVAAMTAPVDAATFAVYAADSDEVFANKTADDFAAVLGEAVTSFEAVTIAGQYPGYIAITATYHNLVFQANGNKYFINYINADDGIAIDNAFKAVVNSIIVYENECTHENVTRSVYDATCTTEGLIWDTCDACGEYTYYEVIPATGHVDTTTTTVDATCTVDGSITVTCVCGEIISTEVIPATGHVDTTTTTVDATCTVDGSITVTCACGEVISTEVIPATGHVDTTTTTVDATCTVDGSITVTCACGEIISTEVIPATGHTLVSEITVMPAIGVAGEKVITCVCGEYTETVALAALTAPNAPNANQVENGWYTTTDGLVQMYVDDWGYYGAYGLTLVKSFVTYPTSATTVAVYAADSDEVFAAKTADDFAAVLGETVNSFTAVTVAGQYPGYIAYTATYRNLVFQANGAKYFINVIAAAGEEAMCDDFFAILAANIIVVTPCTHANTTTTTIDATCVDTGLITVTCDDCGEIISTEVIPATGHVNTTETTVDATCGEAGSITTTCADCGEVISVETIEATGAHTYAWEITSMPAIDVAGEKTFTCGVCGDSYVEAMAALTAPVSAEANTVAGTWYTTNDGLVQLYVADWMYYGSYGLTLVKSGSIPTSAATIAVYAADSDEVFAAKTKADFESVLQETISEFYAVTIAGQYPGYVAYSASYRNLVFQANGAKYFINIIGIEGEQDACEELFQIMMANIIVNEPAACEHANTTVVETVAGTYNTKGYGDEICDDCGEVVAVEVATSYVAPAAELWNTVTEDGWYIYNDGKAAMYVGSWVYYGSYGLTLVGAAGVIPIDAATIAIYTADADDVFAAKTADDFAAVLGEDVVNFTAVTVAGQYPGYIAETASFRNLVFQANGFKYFINYMPVAGDTAEVDGEADFIAAYNSIIVY